MLVVFPEIVMALGSLGLLLYSAWRGAKGTRLVGWMAMGLMAFVASLVCQSAGQGVGLNGMAVSDGLRCFVKVLLLGASAIVFMATFQRDPETTPDHSIMLLFAILGMMVMISAHNLITLYMGLELQNLALYVLVASRREDIKSSEAGVKYFALSALSSGILLFGLSLLYGFAGTMDFGALAKAFGGATDEHALGLTVGTMFVLAGFAFKVSVFPFQMWTPDVYEGAPTPVTAFMATAPKLAAFSVLTLLCLQPLSQIGQAIGFVFAVMSVASMAVGAFGGLRQTSFKRLMGYSAIVNMGTLMVALAVLGTPAIDVVARIEATQSILLYMTLYILGTLGIFSILFILEQGPNRFTDIPDMAGLSQTNPYLAAAMAVCLFSLSGVPPLAGFFGKYFVFLGAVRAGWIALAVLGVFCSVVAAAYYLRVIKIMYFELAPDSRRSHEVAWPQALLIAGICGALVLFIFLPSPFLEEARQAVESLVGP